MGMKYYVINEGNGFKSLRYYCLYSTSMSTCQVVVTPHQKVLLTYLLFILSTFYFILRLLPTISTCGCEYIKLKRTSVLKGIAVTHRVNFILLTRAGM